MAWSVSVTLLTAVLIWKWRRGDPDGAVGLSIVYSLLAPTWWALSVAGLQINVRTTVACIGLVAYCFHPEAKFRRSLTAGDYSILALFGAHLVSDFVNDGFSVVVPIRAYGEWIIPYLAGRVAVQGVRDVRSLRLHVCVVAAVLAATAAIEAFGGTNVASIVAGPRPEDRTPMYQERWFFKRAEGPTTHPIWFGMLQSLLLPWTLSAAAGALGGTAPIWCLGLPLVSLAGVFFSLSRGPIAHVLLAGFASALSYVRARYRALTLAAVLLLGGALSVGGIMQGAHYLSQGWRNRQQKELFVEGEIKEINDTTHRWLIIAVYEPAMKHAGLLGFGTTLTSTFPVRVPLGDFDPKVMKWAWSIDNSYIIMQLRFGLFGLLAFLALIVSSAANGFRIAKRFPDDVRLLSATLGGAMAAMLPLFAVEWMPQDYGFVVLVSAGVVSGLTLRAAELRS